MLHSKQIKKKKICSVLGIKSEMTSLFHSTGLFNIPTGIRASTNSAIEVDIPKRPYPKALSRRQVSKENRLPTTSLQLPCQTNIRMNEQNLGKM